MKQVLLFLSLFHQGGCQVKNVLYRMKMLRPRKGPLPVVSVGNISFGGTEKTPFVLTLIAALLKNGIKPAVITRGYKGTWERMGGVLSDGKSRSGTWRESGDEPFMISLNYPEIGVFVGKNRFLSCTRAHNMGFQIAILDDGFQHRRLHRDLDVVLYDPTENYLLREPFSALDRADILLLKDNLNAEIKKELSGDLPDVDIFTYSVFYEGLYNMDRKEESGLDLKEKRVLAFCGIARPDRFRKLLESEGIKPIQFIAFPDHHTYPPASVKQIVDFCENQNADICLTTEKDAVKIKGIQALRDIPTYFFKIGIQTEDALFAKVLSQLKPGDFSDA
jgi:tetraacyldisaccharide 4'-kinase